MQGRIEWFSTENMKLVSQLLLSGLLMVVGLEGCTYRPAVKPLSAGTEKQAGQLRFPAFFQRWLTENDEVHSQVIRYPYDHWKTRVGGAAVYNIPHEGVADTVKSELLKLLDVYCQANGFGDMGEISFPSDTDGGIGGEGCHATEDMIAAGYAFESTYGREPYTLRIYGESDTLEVRERIKKAEQEAEEFNREQQRKRLQKETERMRTDPRLNELVRVNLASWRTKDMADYELMHPVIANTRAVFTGRIRGIRPPMVLVETGYFPNWNGGRVWVPMESLEAPREWDR